MVCKNKYYRYSKISEAKFRHLIRCFALDLNATDSADMTVLSVRSVNEIFLKMRVRIAEFCEQGSPYIRGNEINDSLFDLNPVYVECPKDRSNKSNTIIFGVFLEDKKVYTEIVPDRWNHALQEIIKKGAVADISNYLNGRHSYHGLVDVKNAKHLCLKNGDDTVNLFWKVARRRLIKFHGVPEHTFYLHLKEAEFRFNHQHENLYKKLLNILRTNPI